MALVDVAFHRVLVDDPWRRQALRTWPRRPDRVRVETVDDALVQIVHESPLRVGVTTSDGERYSATVPWCTDPDAPRPLLRADGLVAARPAGNSGPVAGGHSDLTDAGG